MIAVGIIGAVLALGAFFAIRRTDPPSVLAAIEKGHADARQFYLDTPVERLGELLYLDWLGREFKPHRPFPEEPPLPLGCEGLNEATQELCFRGTWQPFGWLYLHAAGSMDRWRRQLEEFELAWKAWEP